MPSVCNAVAIEPESVKDNTAQQDGGRRREMREFDRDAEVWVNEGFCYERVWWERCDGCWVCEIAGRKPTHYLSSLSLVFVCAW